MGRSKLLVEETYSLNKLKSRVIKSFLDIIILSRLKNGSASGYDIIRHIINENGILLSSGTVYAVLYSLERKGYITGSWNSRKRVYSITLEGLECLKAISNMKESILRMVNNLFKRV